MIFEHQPVMNIEAEKAYLVDMFWKMRIPCLHAKWRHYGTQACDR